MWKLELDRDDIVSWEHYTVGESVDWSSVVNDVAGSLPLDIFYFVSN